MNWKKLFRIFQEDKSTTVESANKPTDYKPIQIQEAYELDEIASRKGLGIYRTMRLDDQVRACSDIKKTLILTSGWKVVGKNQEQVDFIYSCISNLPKSFNKKLKNIMTAYDYGFSITEIVYEKVFDKIYLKNLKTHSPLSCDFSINEFGDVVGVNIGGQTYPKERFVIYSFNDEFENPYGNSDLKSAYSAYFFKQVVWKFWAKHLEGFGSPLIIGKIPPSASKDDKLKFEDIINNIHFKTAVILPRSEVTKEEFSIELLESKREGGSQFKDAINNADERIVRALLFPRLFGLTTERWGSYALGQSQFSIVYSVIEELQSDLAEELNKQLIRRLLNLNFVTPDLSVRIEFMTPNKDRINNLIQSYLSIIKEGILDKQEGVKKITELLDGE